MSLGGLSPGGLWILGVGPMGSMGAPLGVSLAGPRVVSGGSLGVPEGFPGRDRKHINFFQDVWGSRGPSGVILVLWSGPRDLPGRWTW